MLEEWSWLGQIMYLYATRFKREYLLLGTAALTEHTLCGKGNGLLHTHAMSQGFSVLSVLFRTIDTLVIRRSVLVSKLKALLPSHHS